MTILTQAHRMLGNDPPCLYSAGEYKKVIAGLVERNTRLEEALRRIHDKAQSDAPPSYVVGYVLEVSSAALKDWK